MNPFSLYKEFFVGIFEYREYLTQSVLRDLRKKYKRSTLGYVWSMLNPLLMMTILAIVFSNLMKGRIENYAVFLFTGLLPWGYFDGTIKSCLGTITSNQRLIAQVPVPKFIFPVTAAMYNMVDFFLSLVPLILVMLFMKHDIPLTIVYLPMVLVPLFFMAMGLALLFAASNVFFEDTKHLTDVILRAVYFLCPILYPRDLLPGWLVPYITLNPMFGIIESMRELVYEGRMPAMDTYLINLVGSALVLLFGLWVFKKADKKFIYFI